MRHRGNLDPSPYMARLLAGEQTRREAAEARADAAERTLAALTAHAEELTRRLLVMEEAVDTELEPTP